MECACISANIDEEAETLLAKQRTAKKQHTCHECGVQIKPGDQYWYDHIVFEGMHDRFKTCLDCKSVRDHLLCDFYFTMVWETIGEHIEEYSEEMPWAKISRLTPAARAKVCDMIEAVWEVEK